MSIVRKVCPVCGRDYYGTHGRVYCSPECKMESGIKTGPKKKKTRTIYERNCETCGVKFVTTNKENKFCSDECWSTAMEKRKTPREKTCIQCGKLFETTSSWATICSEECRVERNRTRVREAYRHRNCKCEKCGKMFYSGLEGNTICNKCAAEIEMPLLRKPKPETKAKSREQELAIISAMAREYHIHYGDMVILIDQGKYKIWSVEEWKRWKKKQKHTA